MIKIKIRPIKGTTGKTFLQELTRRKNELSKPIAAKLIGDDLEWVLFQEFGTATRRQADEERRIPGPTTQPYRIPSLSNPDPKRLVFPDPHGKYVFLEEFADGYVITDVVYHPGVRPKFFIRNKLNQIRNDTKEIIVQAILNPSAPYSGKSIKQSLLNPVMRQIIDHISDGMAETLHQNREDGKLAGQAPEDVFREKVVVMDSSNELDSTTE